MDGVIRDRVKNVVSRRAYSREHVAKLLGGNCLRFYGPRLARRCALPAAIETRT